MHPAGGIGQADRPALDGADQQFGFIQRGEREGGQPVHPFAHLVGGALVARRFKRAVEQRFDQCGIDGIKRNEVRTLRHKRAPIGPWTVRRNDSLPGAHDE